MVLLRTESNADEGEIFWVSHGLFLARCYRTPILLILSGEWYSIMQTAKGPTMTHKTEPSVILLDDDRICTTGMHDN